MKQPCPSNHILPAACGKGVVFVSCSVHMQNRSVCISINKRTLCVCLAPVMARAVDCFRKLCSNSRISRIFKHWTRNWALKIHTQETYDSIRFWRAEWGLANFMIAVSLLRLRWLRGRDLTCRISNLQTKEPCGSNILCYCLLFQWGCLEYREYERMFG